MTEHDSSRERQANAYPPEQLMTEATNTGAEEVFENWVQIQNTIFSPLRLSILRTYMKATRPGAADSKPDGGRVVTRRQQRVPGAMEPEKAQPERAKSK